MQKIIKVCTWNNSEGFKEVNALLEQDWKILSITPMDGGGDGIASVVALEKLNK